jgi:hypothetical protein
MREINNIGEPLRGPDRKPLGGVKVRFVLSSLAGQPIDALDAVSKERYLPVEITVETSRTDTDELKIGEFSVSLWETSRADRQVFYRCVISNPHMVPFVAPLIAGSTPMKWSMFSQSGSELEPAAVSAFALHLQDDVRHLTANQNAAIDAAHSPSAGNPLATIQDIAVAGGAIPATDVVYGIVRLKTAAEDPADPLVVGDNDERLHDHSNQAALDKITEEAELPLWKGDAWPGSASSGHTIVSPAGDYYPQRGHLKYTFNFGPLYAVTIQDDPENDTTIVLITFPDTISGGQF